MIALISCTTDSWKELSLTLSKGGSISLVQFVLLCQSSVLPLICNATFVSNNHDNYGEGDRKDAMVVTMMSMITTIVIMTTMIITMTLMKINDGKYR